MGLSLVALVVLFASAAPARAANVSCELRSGGAAGAEGNLLVVTDTSESVTHIYREGEEIIVSNNADDEAAVCARAVPTVHNVDRIEYVTDSGVPFINYLGDGPLTPGATDGPGDGDEIEIRVLESYEPKVVNIAGSPEAERIEIGQRRQNRVAVNLNAQADGASPDADLITPLEKGDEIYLRVVAKGGDDTISALGTAGYPDPVTAASRVVMTGGPGDDVINGGPAADSLSGDEGDDELLGGRGRDKISVGPGRDLAKGGKGDDAIENRSDLGGIEVDLFADRIFGGAGNDRITTERGTAGDRVDCGAGRRDSLFGSRGDLARGCETTEFR